MNMILGKCKHLYSFSLLSVIYDCNSACSELKAYSEQMNQVWFHVNVVIKFHN